MVWWSYVKLVFKYNLSLQKKGAFFSFIHHFEPKEHLQDPSISH